MSEESNCRSEPDPGTEKTEPEDIARRAALAMLAKHVAYTTPAVLAILSVSTPRAKAASF